MKSYLEQPKSLKAERKTNKGTLIIGDIATGIHQKTFICLLS